MIKRYLCMTLLFGFCLPMYASATASTDDNKHLTDFPWAIMGYWGVMTAGDLSEIISLQPTFTDETVYSLEFAYQLAADNWLRSFFQPIATTMEVVMNFTYRDDGTVGPIYEINPYVTMRWAHFPWDKIVLTSFAVGEGISYDTQIPPAEITDTNESRKLLNYLMFEITFALPSHPQWELVGRIHHRSGMFGLFAPGKHSGSNVLGVGLRYRF